MPAKSVKPHGRILATLQLATRLYTYFMPPPRFCLDSDALVPRFGETMFPLEKDKLLRLPPCMAGAERGVDPRTFFCLVVLG